MRRPTCRSSCGGLTTLNVVSGCLYPAHAILVSAAIGRRAMAQERKASQAERELLAYSDEVLVRRHAELLADRLGPERAAAILEDLRARILRRAPIWQITKI